jgi:NADPH:quinone reductase-like Zn-dependent oxidoreductase
MPIPKTMRAAVIDRFGPPSVLKVREFPVPAISGSEVLIRIHTAGVGSWDADIRGGWWPEGKPKFPLILGTDGSGTIAAVGARVRRLRVGQEVYAYNFINRKGGFYAQYVAIAADKVAPIPRNLDLRKAGAIAVTSLTALQGIDLLKIKRGEFVIVHGASGGVGTLALQFAKLNGAKVLATASGRDGVAVVKRLGADEAVDGKRDNLTEAARDFAKTGVDAIFATVGGKSLQQCIAGLRRGGRVAYPNGIEPEPRKRKGIRIISYDAEAGVREFAQLTAAIEAAQVKAVISAVYPLERAANAHKRIAAGHIPGKIVLKVH